MTLRKMVALAGAKVGEVEAQVSTGGAGDAFRGSKKAQNWEG
jgi:hypothetical protein